MSVVLTSGMWEWWDQYADLFMDWLDQGLPNERAFMAVGIYV